MVETVEKARVARMHILAEMAKTLAAPRTELSKYAPRIEVSPDQPGKDRRAHRAGRQEHQAPRRGIRLRNQHRGRRHGQHFLRLGGRHEDRARRHQRHDGRGRDRQDLPRARSSPSRNSARSSNSCRARTAWFTSANWRISASSTPRTSSRSATKSRSNAWAWTKRAACASRAKPRWKTATRNTARNPLPRRDRPPIRIQSANGPNRSRFFLHASGRARSFPARHAYAK